MSTDRTEALNDLLVALDEAGAPIELGIGRGALRESLAGLARGDREAASPTYQRLCECSDSSVELAAALEDARTTTDWRSKNRSQVTLGLLYPVLVAVLACCGLVAFCTYLLPVFESAYRDIRQPVGSGVEWLQFAKGTTFLWAPLCVIAGVLLLIFARRGYLLRVTRGRSVGPDQRWAFAQQSVSPAAALQSNSKNVKQPPLLQWATTSNATHDDRLAVRDVYRAAARLGARRYAVYAPLLALVVVAGGAALLYALALFVPVVELLEALAK